MTTEHTSDKTDQHLANEPVFVDAENAKVAKGWRRVAYLTMAGISFVLGVGGALLPGLPATPFLLLSSYFLIRSSPRLNKKLKQSRVFGPILVDWQDHGGVKGRVKVSAIAAVLLTLAFTIYATKYSATFTCIVVALAVIGIVVICRLPVVNRD